jgi:hypothetical protein
MGRKKKQPPVKYYYELRRSKYGLMYEGQYGASIDDVLKVMDNECRTWGGNYLTIYRMRGKRNVKLLIMFRGKILFNNNELDELVKKLHLDCDDCGNEFIQSDLKHWIYQTKLRFCENCYNKRYEKEQKSLVVK